MPGPPLACAFAPSLLASCGLGIPQSMQGHNFLPLLDRKTEGWRNEIYFEMSEFVTGRGLRTPQHTYAVMVPKQPGWRDAASAETGAPRASRTATRDSRDAWIRRFSMLT